MAQTQMEECIETIINIYHEYSIRVGNFDMLNKCELKQLLDKQIPHWLEGPKKNPKALDELFQKLDKDKNKNIDFGEFMVFMTDFAIATHENIHRCGCDGHVHQHPQ